MTLFNFAQLHFFSKMFLTNKAIKVRKYHIAVLSHFKRCKGVVHVRNVSYRYSWWNISIKHDSIKFKLPLEIAQDYLNYNIFDFIFNIILYLWSFWFYKRKRPDKYQLVAILFLVFHTPCFLTNFLCSLSRCGRIFNVLKRR